MQRYLQPGGISSACKHWSGVVAQFVPLRAPNRRDPPRRAPCIARTIEGPRSAAGQCVVMWKVQFVLLLGRLVQLLLLFER